MAQYAYRNFDLVIDRVSGEDYHARVLDSPDGPSTDFVRFTRPISRPDLIVFAGRAGRGSRDISATDGSEPGSAATMKDFGSRLFGAVFADAVGECYDRSLAAIGNGGDGVRDGLRIRLLLAGCPELAELPWEFLYDPERRRFVCLSGRTPIVRYLPVPDRIRPLPVAGALRLLVVVASPKTGLRVLDADAERAKLSGALDRLMAEGRVEMDLLDRPTLTQLHTKLVESDYHVLHFIGHGGFNRTGGEGELYFSDDAGNEDPVTAVRLAGALHDHDTLRLALLNACEGGRSGSVDLLAGTAQTLSHQGVPAVIAMQFTISDLAAIEFSAGFYEAIAAGQPIDAATSTGRTRIYVGGNETEWATPVLYTGAADTAIFAIRTPESALVVPDSVVIATPPEIIVWGANDHGQRDVPTDLADVVAITAGDGYCLALTRSGRVVRWGADIGKQPPWLAGVSAIAAGGRHCLALMGGTVVGWGLDSARQSTTPRRVGPCTAIAAGSAHSVALTSAGTVEAWGSNEDGQVEAQGLSGVTAIAAGGRHSLALTHDGAVVVWGASVPAPPGLGRVTAIAAGRKHSVAVVEDGTVVSWPAHDNAAPTITRLAARAVTAGLDFTVALTDDGVEAWNETPAAHAPVPDGPIIGAVQVAAGASHVMALLSRAGGT